MHFSRRSTTAVQSAMLLAATMLSPVCTRTAVSQETKAVKATVTSTATSAIAAKDEIQLKQEKRQSARPMSFQFSDHQPLQGHLLNVGSIDIRVDGFVIRIPLEVIASVQFSKDFGNDCAIQLTNGDTIRGGILKFEFDVAADWGTVQVTRPTLRSIRVVPPAKAAATTIQQPT